MFSNKLLDLIKTKPNVRIFFVDSREGDYLIPQKVYSKIIKWLDDNNINHLGKFIFSTLNDKEKYNIPNDSRLQFFNNEHYITLAIGHVTSCLKNDEIKLETIEKEIITITILDILGKIGMLKNILI